MTKQDEFDSIEQLIKSSDIESVILGYNMIATNEFFVEVRQLYESECNNLPDGFNRFRLVCDFVKQNTRDNAQMRKSPPQFIKSIYRPASLLVLSKMRLIYDQTAKDEKIVSTR